MRIGVSKAMNCVEVKATASRKLFGGTLEAVAELLPPPLDTAVLADFRSSKLRGVYRASAVGLLGAWADLEQEDASSWDRYDDIDSRSLRTTDVPTPCTMNLSPPCSMCSRWRRFKR